MIYRLAFHRIGFPDGLCMRISLPPGKVTLPGHHMPSGYLGRPRDRTSIAIVPAVFGATMRSNCQSPLLPVGSYARGVTNFS